MNTSLKISNITKIYPGCVANDNVSLEFNSGKIFLQFDPNPISTNLPTDVRLG